MLAVSVGGRRTQHVTRKPISDSKMSYTTVIETRPFFDKSEGFTYNMQSWMMIASAVMMLLGSLLAYMTYNAYPTALFAGDFDDDYPPIAGGDGFNGGRNGYGGAAPTPGFRPPQQQPGQPPAGGNAGRQQQPVPGNAGRQQQQQQQQGQNFRAFEGEGQRLKWFTRL